MKTIRTTIAAAMLSLSLAACSSTGQVVNPFANGTINVGAVQNAAVVACGFLPTVATVTGIVSAASGIGGAALQTAEQVASAICAAVVPLKSGKLRGTPMVNGIAVHGRFVR